MNYSMNSKTPNSLWILEISYKNELFYIKFAWNVNSKSWAVTKRYALYIIKFLRIKIFPQFSRKHHNWYPMLITHSRQDNTHSWRFQFVLLHLINKMSATILFPCSNNKRFQRSFSSFSICERYTKMFFTAKRSENFTQPV